MVDARRPFACLVGALALAATCCAPAPTPLELPRVEGAKTTVVLIERVIGDGSSEVARAVVIDAEHTASFLDDELTEVPRDLAVHRVRVNALYFDDAPAGLGLAAGVLAPAGGDAGRTLPVARVTMAALLTGESWTSFAPAEPSPAVRSFRYVPVD